ncbi:DUF262 domain-containing protein (plasmid) [Polymorphobacter sp. PAMC 29334]|uniref:DUF262 domain-containing protein n=1 Tax=Polymorphobacter sp. PAMC 29334 TaxID=2862331 RepID=UPI001C6630C1|nr:DUF262 domain-containing protein [Polymorphobacter sp. PAMC 29334]QYE37228.1 DUF262 domain-containing protein [Polymorphobacter sp. PAMC 29334]
MTQPEPTAEPNEDPEGLDIEPTLDEPSAYPLDHVMVRSETRTVSEVIKRINTGRYIMDPDFQRDFVWLPEKQSKLIESCVMRIPLPVFYVAEAQDGRVAVVDGLQRLSTFRRFLANELRLAGLGKDSLDGKKFDELPIHLQERIEDTQLTLYILDKEAPEVARLDIFERVNGGEPLTRQQMRNAIYNGEATRWLAQMAKTVDFQKATEGSLNPKTMRDREAINRFAAFRLLGYEQYENGDMDEFLGRALKEMNRMSVRQLDELTSEFVRSMQINYLLFGRHSFRKTLRDKSGAAYRSVINIALFDTMSVLLARLTPEQALAQKDELALAIMNLTYDNSFEYSITNSTNSTARVRTRFKMAEYVLMDLIQ